MSEFKKYWEEYESNNHVLGSEEYCAKLAWNARQSEIDQLKAQLEVKHSAPNHKTQFEDMIRQSPDFATLLNIHGERLFIKRELSYDILAMRSAYWTWLWVHTLYKDVSETCSEMVDEIEDLEAEIEKLKAEKVGLEKHLDAIHEVMNDYYTGSFDDAPELAGLISAVLGGTND